MTTINLSPFKLDMDELIEEFVEGGCTTLADMKRVWLSRKFSHIYQASPSTKLALFMQSLYAHTIGYMVGNDSLSRRLGGLYCLYCLYETQPFKPPFRIYISLGELKKLRRLIVDAKKQGVTVVPPLVRRMLEKNMFLFGLVESNESSVNDMVSQMIKLQNARIQLAYEKLFANTQIEQFLHMDLGMECDMSILKKMSTEYSDAKKLAIQEASKSFDVQDIDHLADDEELVGDVVDKISEKWNAQREMFYCQTGSNWGNAHEREHHHKDQQDNDGGNNDVHEFSNALELQLMEEEEEEAERVQDEDEDYSDELKQILAKWT